MDDYDVNDLPDNAFVYFVVSTAGQGEFPKNSHHFWKALSDSSLEQNLLKNVKYSVFGLGDSSYVHFNKAAEEIDMRMESLGG